MTKLLQWKIASTLCLVLATVGPLAAQTFSTVLNFEEAISGASGGPLVQGADGNLYGTGEGGEYQQGTIFRVNASGVLTVLYNFCADNNCPDGSSPGALLLGTDGNFYGVAAYGGNTSCEFGWGSSIWR